MLGVPEKPSPLRALTDALTVLGTTARLIGRHWPTLLAITIFGYAARDGLLTLAMKASAISSAFGSLVLALVPIAVLTSYILCFMVLRPSLPGLTASARTKGRLIGDVGSALVPFFVIYSAYGIYGTRSDLQADFGDYLYAILWDGDITQAKDARMPFDLTTAMLVVAGCTIGLRTILDWWKRASRFALIGYVKAYLDVISIIVIWVTILKPGWDWVTDRQAVNAVTSLLSSTDQKLGPFSVQPMWEGATSAVEPVILLPVAWLAVAAVVYGDKLRDLPSPVEFRTYRRFSVLPKRARKAVMGISAAPRERFAAIILAVRVLRRANLPMMLLFCLAFVVVRTVPKGLWELERLIVGPQDLETVWIPLSALLAVLNGAIGASILICLVAAGAEQLIVAQRGEVTPPVPAVSAVEGEPGIPGQEGPPLYADRDGTRAGSRHEVELHLEAR